MPTSPAHNSQGNYLSTAALQKLLGFTIFFSKYGIITIIKDYCECFKKRSKCDWSGSLKYLRMQGFFMNQ